MDGLNDILGKLTDEDIASLQAAADAMFGGSNSFSQDEETQQEPQQTQQQGGMFGGISPAMLQKISSLMGKMNQKDSRSDLIYALKPHLSPAKRKRADEAVQLMRMMELLPTLQQAMQDDEKP